MHDSLNRNVFLVKEHVGMFKAANNYDIYDPETGDVIMLCREENLGALTKFFRFTKYKRMTPFDIRITTPEGQQLVRVTRGLTFLRSKVTVLNGNDEVVGGFSQKLLAIGGAFDVLDQDDQVICSLKGKWTGWDFRFVAGDTEFAHVTKKWAGIGKEFFTSADNYILKIADTVPPDNRVRLLILAAVMCIDMVLKE
ncbi:MAG: RNAase [Gemmatimonadetes bacterium]|nr:RNAase [Gemmatimonadota bacterium]